MRLVILVIAIFFLSPIYTLQAQRSSNDEGLENRIGSILSQYVVFLNSQMVLGNWSDYPCSIEIKPNHKFRRSCNVGAWGSPIRKQGKWSWVNQKLLLRRRNELDSMEFYLIAGEYYMANSDFRDDSWEEAKVLSYDISKRWSLSDEELLRLVTSCIFKKSSSTNE